MAQDVDAGELRQAAELTQGAEGFLATVLENERPAPAEYARIRAVNLGRDAPAGYLLDELESARTNARWLMPERRLPDAIAASVSGRATSDSHQAAAPIAIRFGSVSIEASVGARSRCDLGRGLVDWP